MDKKMTEFSYVEDPEVLVLDLAHESRKTRDGDGTPPSRDQMTSAPGVVYNQEEE